MMKNWILSTSAVLTMLTGAALAADGVAGVGSPAPAAPTTAPAAVPVPYLLKPEGHQFTILKNWTFGNDRPDATVRNKDDLDKDFYYRYIWEQGKLDKFDTCWSYYRDYPEGDPKSLHVFSDHAVTLKGRIPPGGGLKDRGIESGMIRAKMPITPGMYIEMRAKLTGGVGVWPNFWLGEGVQYPDGTFTPPPKVLPEIDIFEFFNWDGRPQTQIMVCNIQTFGGAAAYGHPHDLFTTLQDAGYEWHRDLGFDCSKEFHVYALDWVENQPIWLLDGRPIKQTYYEWHGSPAHLMVCNTIGMKFKGVKLAEMTPDEKQWDYTIDYLRVWDHKTTPSQKLAALQPYPLKAEDWPGAGVTPGGKPLHAIVAARSWFWVQRDEAKESVIFIGDSNIAGWKDLAQAIPKLKVTNRGLAGDLSRDLLFRFKEDVLDLNAKAVVIQIGEDDLTAMGKPSDILSNLAEVVAMAEKERPEMPVVLCSIASSADLMAPIKAEDRKAVNEGIQKLASEHKNTRFCDLSTALANEDGSPKPEYFGDKFHITGPGFAKWAELLTPIFDELNLK